MSSCTKLLVAVVMYTAKKRKWAVEAVGRDLYAEIRGKGLVAV